MKNINTKEYWNNIWSVEGKHTWRVYPKTFSEISKEVGSKKRVLDVGCGVGILSNILNENNYVEGVDISNSAIEILSQSNIKGKVADVPPLPFENNEFDVIVACEFLEHFIETDKILLELKRVAKKVIIAVPNNILGHENEKEHYQKFTEESLKKLLSYYFKKVKITEFIDRFPVGKIMIALPVLMAVCE